MSRGVQVDMNEGRQSKSAKRQQRREAARRAQRRRRLIVGVAAAAAVLAAVGFAVSRPEPIELQAVETFEDQGQEHVDPATAPGFEYNSKPATSGPHAPQPVPCGIYRQAVPDLLQVHNLEHGAVVINYSPDLGEGARSTLEEFARSTATHILVAPRQDLDSPIVLTAWTRKLSLDEVDVASIEAFYDRFARRGPERGIPCPFQTDESGGG